MVPLGALLSVADHDAKLYVIQGSHACRTAMLMLDHKGIDYETVTLPAGFQPYVIRYLGFRSPPGFSRRVDNETPPSQPTKKPLEGIRRHRPMERKTAGAGIFQARELMLVAEDVVARPRHRFWRRSRPNGCQPSAARDWLPWLNSRWVAASI